MKAALCFIVASLSACNCNPTQITPAAAPRPAAAATTMRPWDAGDPCQSAYDRLVDLGCTPKVEDWVVVCRKDMANGIPFGTGCIRDAFAGNVAVCGVTCITR